MGGLGAGGGMSSGVPGGGRHATVIRGWCSYRVYIMLVHLYSVC